MNQSTVNVLLLLIGVTAFWYVVKTRHPGWWAMCLAFAVSGGVALGLVGGRRQLAHPTGTTLVTRSWSQEMLVGGEPIKDSPYLGGERVAGAVIWVLVWAAFLRDDDSRSDERGPWLLALLPLVVVAVAFALGPGWVARAGTGTTDASRVHGIVGTVLVVYVLGFALYAHSRRSR